MLSMMRGVLHMSIFMLIPQKYYEVLLMLYVQFKLNECRERRVLKIPNKKLQYNETTVTILIFIRV